MFVCFVVVFVVVSHFIFLVSFSFPRFIRSLLPPCFLPFQLYFTALCYLVNFFLLLSSFRAFRLPRSFGWQCLKSFPQPSFPAPETFLCFLSISPFTYRIPNQGEVSTLFNNFLKNFYNSLLLRIKPTTRQTTTKIRPIKITG